VRGLAAALVAGIAACALVAAPAQASEHIVDPHATSTAIAAESSRGAWHRAWDAQGGAGTQLLLFLGGSDSRPSSYETIGAVAAAAGYDSVDLRYLNPAIAQSCDGSSDACFSDVRGSTIFGEGSLYGRPDSLPWSSTAVAVDVANSIVNRVVCLLQSLGWTRYLVSDTASPYGVDATHRAYPRWSQIVVAGHSQGAGHALFIARRLSVLRAVMLSGPTDSVAGAPAAWLSGASATPAANLFGLSAGANEGSYCAHCGANWDSAGLSAAQQLTTTLRPGGCLLMCSALNWHDSTAVDSGVHRDGLTQASPATLAPTWRQLFAGTLQSQLRQSSWHRAHRAPRSAWLPAA
jgi:hypothetical protein